MENRMNWIPVGAVAVLLLAGMIASGIAASDEEPTPISMGEKCTALYNLVNPYLASGQYNSIADFNHDGSVELSDAVIFTSHSGDEEWCVSQLPAPSPVVSQETSTYSGGYGGSRFLAKGTCYWHSSKNIVEFGLDLPSGMQLPTGADFTSTQFRQVCGLYQTAWKEGLLDEFLSSLKPFEIMTGKQ